jgi:hypothetical protein
MKKKVHPKAAPPSSSSSWSLWLCSRVRDATKRPCKYIRM